MKELIILPAVVILLLGVALELESIARTTSDKAIGFAGDMEDAMDCAVTGRPIRECSPGLYTTNFDDETEETIHALNKTIEIIDGMDDDL